MADDNDQSTSPAPGPLWRGLLSKFQHPQAACRHSGAIVLFLAVTAAGLAGDLWSKHAVFQSLLSDADVAQRASALQVEYGRGLQADQALRLMGLHRPVFTGFRLTLSTNPGVVFGLPMPPPAVAVATLFTICLVGCFFATSRAADRWVHLALALIFGGALGNFYDRMLVAVAVPGFPGTITGQVRDFLDFSSVEVFGLRYPYVFNIADVLLVVGVAMLILHWWKAGREEKKTRGHGDAEIGRRGDAGIGRRGDTETRGRGEGKDQTSSMGPRRRATIFLSPRVAYSSFPVSSSLLPRVFLSQFPASPCLLFPARPAAWYNLLFATRGCSAARGQGDEG